jgi:hypothetical protein
MATISYAFVSRCSGGGHTILDITLNGGATRRVAYATDDIREPLTALSDDERAQLALLILKVHLAGKTRPQIVSEFNAGPITVTI